MAEHLSVSMLMALILASPLVGQGADPKLAAGVDTTKALPLAPLVVTVSKVPIRADRAGFQLSVVSARDLEMKRPLYIADALRDLPGSYIDEAAGPGGPTIVRLRGGEEVFTQILMDGVQINENGGFFDFQGFTLSNLDRIEVARGPQSALYGSSAVSGVVQFITPRGRAGRTRVEFVGEGGTATEQGGSFRSSLSASGGSDSFQFSAGAGVAFNRGIYQLANDTWTGDVSLRGDWVASDRWETTGLFRFVRYDGSLPVRDAGATRVPLDPNARNDRDRVVSSVAARFTPSTRWRHEFKGTLYWEDFLFQDTEDGVMQPPDFFIFDFDLDFASTLLRPGFEYTGSYRTDTGGDRDLTVSVGGRLEREQVSSDLDFAGALSGTEFGRNSVTGFAEVLGQLSPRLSLLASARAEKYRDLETEVTPRASVVFDAIPNVLAIRGGWGQAYKVPNLQQQFGDNPFLESNPDLKPETSESVEVGFDVRAPSDRRFDFARFYDALAERSFLIYPGKLTQAASFRIGCIGRIDEAVMQDVVAAVAEVTAEMGFDPVVGSSLA